MTGTVLKLTGMRDGAHETARKTCCLRMVLCWVLYALAAWSAEKGRKHWIAYMRNKARRTG